MTLLLKFNGKKKLVKVHLVDLIADLFFFFFFFLPFHTVHGVLKAIMLKWFAPAPSPVDHVLSELSIMTPSVLGDPTWHGS